MPRGPEKKLQVVVNVLAFYGAVGVMVAALFILYPECALLVFESGDLPAYMPLLGVTILLWLVSSNLEVVPLALGDVRASSVFIVISQLTKSALTLGAALAFHSVRAMIWAAAIQGMLQILFMLAYIRRRFGQRLERIRDAFDLALFKAQIGNALPYGLGSFAQTAQGDLHNFMVSRYFPPAGFAVYSAGLFQLPLLGVLTISFRDALIPEVSRLAAAGDQRAIIPIWLNAARKLALVVVPICALMFVLLYQSSTLRFHRCGAACRDRSDQRAAPDNADRSADTRARGVQILPLQTPPGAVASDIRRALRGHSRGRTDRRRDRPGRAANAGDGDSPGG